MPVAVLRVAVLEAGWSHPVELLGCVHSDMAVETVGHHRGLCGYWSVGTQPPVQVDSHTPLRVLHIIHID